jgi:hypothetical protein
MEVGTRPTMLRKPNLGKMPRLVVAAQGSHVLCISHGKCITFNAELLR